MQTCFTLLVNMLTGLLVWEDWRVVSAWGAYVSVHMIMILAIYLLAPSDFVQMYRNRKLRLALNVDPDALEAKLVAQPVAGGRLFYAPRSAAARASVKLAVAPAARLRHASGRPPDASQDFPCAPPPGCRRRLLLRPARRAALARGRHRHARRPADGGFRVRGRRRRGGGAV